ncbi:peptide/nickel transport system substrate-binding protein [Frankineae bacterium MT45]|nr:peptide/nickel transport system substrate-binding protein [Frankineae bacterium MT45]
MKTLHPRIKLTAASVAAVALLSACTAGAHPTSNDSTISGANPTASGYQLITDTPAAKSEVDKVTWNDFEGEPQTIDPYLSADYTPNMINSNMCETLLLQTPTFSITPNLASSFENPDPLHWVYNLRSDVKFWDGAPMTAEDVAFSLQHNLTDKTTFYSYLFSRVAKIAVTGEHQVTVTLNKPDYVFNDELSSYAGVVVEKKFFQQHGAKFGSPSVGLMCTGPFEFSKWTQGQSIVLKRNPNYWNTALQPKVKELDFTFVTDESAITAGLQTGQIDGSYDVPWSSVAQLQKSSEGTVSFGPAQLNSTIVYSNPSGTMSNLSLRQALQMAIDWNGIAKTIFKGAATPLRAQQPPTAFGFAKDALQPAYDALPDPQSAQYDEAKKMVAAAGAAASKPVVMVVPDAGTGQQFGLAIEDAAKRIGLKFQLKVVPTAQYGNYLYDPKTRAGVDILATTFWPNIPNPMDWFGITAVTGGSFNQYNYTGIDALYASAQATQDPSARAQIMVQIQQKLRDDLLPMVPGVTVYNSLWMNKRITGAPASFAFVYYPWAAKLGGTS